ncbi:MAG: galactokinase [Defluviitaleaceae bacterium]|nr:galactokinase [Defluviitaleaceae bacterium]
MDLGKKFTEIFGGGDILTNRNFFQKSSEVSVREQPPARNESELLSFHEYSKIRTFHAPGRVNIIGEHTDYNGGFVLPCAINMGTYALIRPRGDDETRFASTNDVPPGWEIYPRGIVHHMRERKNFGGFDMLFSGDIPSGAGLSSSASIEMATAVAINETFALGFEMLELVKLAQESENNFCGVNCGIMDMFAIGMGKKGFATYLHCDSMKFEYVPLTLSEFQMVIMDTKKRRSLNESRYNERRAECEAAHPARMRHVSTENERVKAAISAMNAGDVPALGRLLVESHNSLRDDFEVSCFELDTLVDLAIKNPACVGARMMGAGFGGCAIAIVKREKVQNFADAVCAEYEKIVGHACAMYPAESGDGAREVYARL